MARPRGLWPTDGRCWLLTVPGCQSALCTSAMDCCTRGRAADGDFGDLRGGAAGAGPPTPRQQVVFDSIDQMESWVAEGGWTCLLLVGNNAAGYTERAYKVRENGAERLCSLPSREPICNK